MSHQKITALARKYHVTAVRVGGDGNVGGRWIIGAPYLNRRSQYQADPNLSKSMALAFGLRKIAGKMEAVEAAQL